MLTDTLDTLNFAIENVAFLREYREIAKQCVKAGLIATTSGPIAFSALYAIGEHMWDELVEPRFQDDDERAQYIRVVQSELGLEQVAIQSGSTDLQGGPGLYIDGSRKAQLYLYEGVDSEKEVRKHMYRLKRALIKGETREQMLLRSPVLGMAKIFCCELPKEFMYAFFGFSYSTKRRNILPPRAIGRLAPESKMSY